jgi:hypothetical protein
MVAGRAALLPDDPPVLVLPLEVLVVPVPFPLLLAAPLLPATVVLLLWLLAVPLLPAPVVVPLLLPVGPPLAAPVVPLPSPAVGAGAQAARVQPIAATKQRERVMAATSERP